MNRERESPYGAGLSDARYLREIADDMDSDRASLRCSGTDWVNTDRLRRIADKLDDLIAPRRGRS